MATSTMRRSVSGSSKSNSFVTVKASKSTEEFCAKFGLAANLSSTNLPNALPSVPSLSDFMTGFGIAHPSFQAFADEWLEPEVSALSQPDGADGPFTSVSAAASNKRKSGYKRGAQPAVAGPPAGADIYSCFVEPGPPSRSASSGSGGASNKRNPKRTKVGKNTPARARAAATTAGGPAAAVAKRRKKPLAVAVKVEPGTLCELPASAVLLIPPSGLHPGEEVELLAPADRPGVSDVKIKVTISHGQAAEARHACGSIYLRLSDPALCHTQAVLYQAKLRGDRTIWVTRKKMQTILRNRRSASLSRQTIVDLKDEVENLRARLEYQDKALSATMRLLNRLDDSTHSQLRKKHGGVGSSSGGSSGGGGSSASKPSRPSPALISAALGSTVTSSKQSMLGVRGTPQMIGHAAGGRPLRRSHSAGTLLAR